ncbi:hypothetical protein RHGRI_020353 [Rhododendron griersonianum]|uniref:Zinc finger LSD1-type domain-containing protein n=1 Tax=Rhododendron griersonianum TaxID=479676 RepID=A0AAV6JJC9_9ERIC|nr:hypothetical protein RHGRI_020353 [Rhododendron griersonianum]
MPVPLAPYPTPTVPVTPPAANGAQSQLVCSGCRNLLLYPVGATSVCCAVCNAVTAVPPPANQVAHVNCGNCQMLLMYQYGARSVKCAVCNFVTTVGVSLNKHYRTEVQQLKLQTVWLVTSYYKLQPFSLTSSGVTKYQHF